MMKEQTYFISYTTRTPNDEAWAKWVSWVLENKLGIKTIIQEYDFHVGDNFKERMHDALKRADAVVLILTRTYMESAYCTEEWTNADKIIPIRFDNCSPEGLLKTRVYIDLFDLDKDSARNRLMAKLKGSVRPENEPDAPFATYSTTTPAAEPEYPSASTLVSNLPNRNKYFTGREDILDKIYAGFKSSPVVSVIGLGGIGKTQISIEYAYQHASDYKLIWYFNADSDEDCREFARRVIGLDNASEVDFVTVKRVLDDWFRKNSPNQYLLIYDNAEGCTDLKKYLPPNYGKSHILINSRERLIGIVAERLPATVFSTTDSVSFLQKRIPTADTHDAQTLADALGDLPLALECAAAYIEEKDYTLPQYLKLYEQHHLRVLNNPAASTEYDKTIMTVWNATFESISKEAEHDALTKAAFQLFKLCACCASDDIPLQFFIDGRNEAPQPLRDYLDPNDTPSHDEIISRLIRYSLITMRRIDDNALISVHRLIQAVVNHGFEQNKEWVDCCLRIAGSVFDYEYGTRKEFDEFTLNMPHVIEITRHAAVSMMDDDSQIKIALLYSKIGKGLRSQGDYPKALEWYYKALAIYEKVLGAEHPDTATTYNNIALVYHAQGDYPKALEWYFKALAIFEKALGAEHPDTATTYNNIALVYKAQSDYPKALEWYYKALEIKEKVLGAEHPSTATTYNNIAGVYYAQGDYAKALEWYYKALAIFEKALGAEHPYTAGTYNNIQKVLQRIGKSDAP